MSIVHKIKKALIPSKYKVTYDQDGLTTIHNNGFMLEPDFIRAEQAGVATGSWSHIHWRVHTILWAASHCKDIEGDFVECGTNKGGLAKAVCEYLDFATVNKTFYLLDTFQGLDEDLMKEEEKSGGKKEFFRSAYSDCYEQVKNTFSSIPNVKIIRGSVPGTLAQVPSARIAFLSIDMNNVNPEIAALDYFWDKLSKGGIIVLDDYAYVTYHLQYEAHNNWAKQKGIKILSLPTGQGLIIK